MATGDKAAGDNATGERDVPGDRVSTVTGLATGLTTGLEMNIGPRGLFTGELLVVLELAVVFGVEATREVTIMLPIYN